MTKNQIKCVNHVAPFFSLIMPVHNGQKFLQQAMESVLKQTFSDFELIVVDDGSTDASLEIVQELARQDNRIKYLQQPGKKGVSAARNIGLTSVLGKYVGFCDADDYLEPNLLQSVYMNLIRQQVDLVVFGFYEDYYDDDCKLLAKELKVAAAGLFIGEAEIIPRVLYLFRDNLYQYVWNKFYKLAWLHEQQAGFKEISYGEDMEFNLKLCHALQSLLVLPGIFYHYRRSEHDSLSAHYIKDFLPVHLNLLEYEYTRLQQQKFFAITLPVLSEICVRYAFVGLQMAFYPQAPQGAFAAHYQQMHAFTHFKE